VLPDGVFLLEIFVFQQEFGGSRIGGRILLLEYGGFLRGRPVFLLPDGVFLLPVAVACRKSPGSCSKPGRACRQSRRSFSRAAVALNLCKKGLTRGREVGTLGSGNKSPTPCRIMINLGSFTINRACSTMRRRHL